MTTTRHRPVSRRAFSLIELLIVILIIALIIAIVLPALAHTRKTARNQATRDLMVQVQQACSSFILSEGHMPGYFSAKEMGAGANQTEGFTGMENVMFDLAGGIVPTGSTGNVWACGPDPARTVLYNPDLVGVAQAGNKSYFTPPSKYFKLQNGVEGLGTKMANTNHQNYVRDLVDAEGMPLLMWSADQMAIQPVAAQSDFAALKSDGAAQPTAARFYWTSNYAFLASSACGDKRIDQASESILGNSNPNGAVSMIGLLGNPSSPNNVTNTGPLLLPTTPRGQFVIQAAGSDTVYVARGDAPHAGDRGGKIVGPANTLGYDLSFRSQPSSDIMADFDDLLIAGGN